MEEEKEFKKFYFFQFSKNMFESKEFSIVTSLAEEMEENPNDYLILWIQLITKTLDTSGIIQGPVSARYLRRFLNFRTNKHSKEDIEFVEKAIKLFKEEKLLIITYTGDIYIPIVEELTMNKKESSEFMRIKRRKENAIKKSATSQELTPDEEFDLFFEKTFAGLVFNNYAKKSDEEKYRATFLELKNLNLKYLNQATDDFIKNKIATLGFNPDSIVDKANYLFATIKKFANDPERAKTYEQIELLKNKKDIPEEERKELEEIASYDCWQKN